MLWIIFSETQPHKKCNNHIPIVRDVEGGKGKCYGQFPSPSHPEPQKVGQTHESGCPVMLKSEIKFPKYNYFFRLYPHLLLIPEAKHGLPLFDIKHSFSKCSWKITRNMLDKIHLNRD